ncbi:PREDICTED: rap guanine nucleotide exchange factor 1-like [Amphimedon queenslandica]|uniref:Ras-GEF domain-containing protein n=1 Tax=Amphimedon queenslandica TaxID=400682 RepID=A0AAN0JZJ8_AMPQE|nr:PREDICTED: rap guanine nucleotide exchange factor 1-like [Amphimedon queenslandica]|eukprot:XP_019862540.1 PREDICTED: rap guanine nucleotide exchange factor 1-like [Amphimedon queenslandica]
MYIIYFFILFYFIFTRTKSRLLEKDLEWKKREKLMVYFISVMKSLREFGNFNAYLAILSAIESAPVSRLDWSEKILKTLEEPRALIDSRGSFKNYRQAFSQTKPPCIPYIGLYLQDLTFLEEQPSKLEDGVSVNFSKRWKQFRSVDHIRFSQTKQYGQDFHPDPNIMGVFNNFADVETDESLWDRSTDIKPSNRQKSSTQSSSANN